MAKGRRQAWRSSEKEEVIMGCKRQAEKTPSRRWAQRWGLRGKRIWAVQGEWVWV